MAGLPDSQAWSSSPSATITAGPDRKLVRPSKMTRRRPPGTSTTHPPGWRQRQDALRRGTAPSGGGTAPSGDAAAPSGGATAPSGDGTAPAGDATAPAGGGTLAAAGRAAAAGRLRAAPGTPRMRRRRRAWHRSRIAAPPPRRPAAAARPPRRPRRRSRRTGSRRCRARTPASRRCPLPVTWTSSTLPPSGNCVRLQPGRPRQVERRPAGRPPGRPGAGCPPTPAAPGRPAGR